MQNIRLKIAPPIYCYWHSCFLKCTFTKRHLLLLFKIRMGNVTKKSTGIVYGESRTILPHTCTIWGHPFVLCLFLLLLRPYPRTSPPLPPIHIPRSYWSVGSGIRPRKRMERGRNGKEKGNEGGGGGYHAAWHSCFSSPQAVAKDSCCDDRRRRCGRPWHNCPKSKKKKKGGGESSPLALALMEKEEERRPPPRKQKRERDPTLIGGGVSILRLLLSRKKPPFSDSLLSPNVEEDGASINSGLIPIF